MQRFFLVVLSITMLGFTACPGPGPITPEPTWQEVTSPTFQPAVGDWADVDCPAKNFERVDTAHTIVLGLQGYPDRCVFAAKPLDLSSLPVGTKVRVTLKQKSGPFPADAVVPFWTHLWLRTNGAAPDKSQIRPMLLVNNAESEATTDFTIAEGTKSLDLLLGVDPSNIALTKPEDQPVVEFKLVKVEALK